jgi:hypothetical protein
LIGELERAFNALFIDVDPKKRVDCSISTEVVVGPESLAAE